MPCFIQDFHSFRPTFESHQKDTLEWILAAHVKSESVKQGTPLDSDQMISFEEQLRSNLMRVCCKPGVIEERGHFLEDFKHTDWNQMQIYRLEEFPQGAGLSERQNVHREIVNSNFEHFYREVSEPPAHLIHVSCTGYASPSGAQHLVSQKQWGDSTTVTHAYHMGCYGSVPAIRLASAFGDGKNSLIDIVHTELCTLHFNPLLHEPEYLVGQSLFADGVIKYTAASRNHSGASCLRVLGTHEQLIPKTSNSMAWLLSDWGFQFILSKEIPMLISNAIENYVRVLCDLSGVKLEDLIKSAIFAVHPGGPRILDQVEKILQLRKDQIKASRHILQKYGNMSSATLPHIWKHICEDANIQSGTKVISMAFGPGLTIAGLIMEKED